MAKYRIHPQAGFNFEELTVDNFAGGGGASTGIEAALGRPVDIAINHDPAAVAMHEVNHPHTLHLCESVWDVDPKKVCAGRPVGLAWFSPDCKHFSKAKGGKPVEKKIRGLAWVVMKWVGTVRPRVIMLENVEEFVTWGPVVDGRPCPKRKGRTFQSFVNALRRHGYEVEWRELRACDYGTPTIRKRLFLVARCDGQSIVWPEPTHGDPKSQEVKAGKLKPWRTAAECIDWSIPCPSIFERKRPLAEATLRRIAKGIMRYVVESPEPFIVSYYGEKKGDKGRGQKLRDPLRTQTTENRFALVSPTIVGCGGRMGQSPPRGGDQPFQTVTAKADACLVSAFLAKHYTGVVGSSLSDPAATVTSVDHHSLVAAHLTKFQQNSLGQYPVEPVHTVMAGAPRFGLVAAHLVRQFGKSVGNGAGEPVGTITAGGGGKTMLATSHLVKLRGTCRDGQSVTEPAPTVTAGGLHVGEVRAFLMKYYGNEKEGINLESPMHTVTTKDRFGLVTVRGEEYRIIDIGMRMLSPRELYRAQGFPENYIIERTADGKPVTKTEQVAKCGNSVCPPIAEALVKANVAETASASVAI